MISAHHLHKSYGSLHVLNDISLHIAPAEVVSIVGASGAGKTTLLQLLGTLDRPDSAEVIISGTDVTRLSDKALSRFRNEHIGFVFQFHNLLPEFTAIENICLPALIRGVPLAQAQDDARRLLESLNLADRANHKPAALSGGEQQRVAVARALLNKHSVILADEPSGNLDAAHARDLHNLFFLLREQYHQTFIIVTHNEELALMADRKIILKDGKNIQV